MKRVIVATVFPTDDEGNPRSGFVQIGTTDTGALILDCEDRAELPDGAELVSEGPPSSRFDRTALGSYADRVLEAAWERDEDRGREKRAVALDRDPPVTINDDNLRPHVWLGET